jgi:3-oxoadipate enol-lactonase
MPMIDADGCPLNVEVEGPANAPVLMLCNSLGTTLHMWDDQAPAWSREFRLVRYDRRGHGKSGAPKGPYTYDRLGRDALAIMDGLGLKKVNWCGLSMGGMVGQWLGANAPDRVEKIILSNTHNYFPDKNMWAARIKTVEDGGVAATADATMERWFTKEFRENSPDKVARFRAMVIATPKDGFLGCCAAIRDMDLREADTRIKAPTLIIIGRRDPATPPEAGEDIHQRIKGSKLVGLDAAHISNVEQPKAYTDTVLNFLKS